MSPVGTFNARGSAFELVEELINRLQTGDGDVAAMLAAHGHGRHSSGN